MTEDVWTGISHRHELSPFWRGPLGRRVRQFFWAEGEPRVEGVGPHCVVLRAESGFRWGAAECSSDDGPRVALCAYKP